MSGLESKRSFTLFPRDNKEAIYMKDVQVRRPGSHLKGKSRELDSLKREISAKHKSGHDTEVVELPWTKKL